MLNLCIFTAWFGPFGLRPTLKPEANPHFFFSCLTQAPSFPQPYTYQDGIVSFLINSSVDVGPTLNSAMVRWQSVALCPSQAAGSLYKFWRSRGGDKTCALVRLSCFGREENRIIWYCKRSWNLGFWCAKNLNLMQKIKFKNAYPLFLRADLFWGEDSPGLPLTKCESFMGLKALTTYFMGLILEQLLLFRQSRCLMLSYQALAAGLWLVRNCSRYEVFHKVLSFSKTGLGLLGVQKTQISGREQGIFCPLKGT